MNNESFSSLLKQLFKVWVIFKEEYKSEEDIHAAIEQLRVLIGIVIEKIFTEKNMMKVNSKGYPKVIDGRQFQELNDSLNFLHGKMWAEESRTERWAKAAKRRADPRKGGA